MATFLTTREVQDLINVDRSTVYRMAEDGRLPAVKVGRQWRFPADRISEHLGLRSPRAADPPAPDDLEQSPTDLSQLLVPRAAQSIADLLGDLFGVMAVVTDMGGRPLTSVANPCGFYATIGDRPEAIEACLDGWRRLSHDPELIPRFVPSHMGFLCARTFIRVGSQLVGMVIVGGVTPDVWPPSSELVEASAWILGLLPRVGDLISQLASARSQLLSKLDAIAALAGPAASLQGSEP
jgi:excisionase family DNA binding protein